AAFALRFRPSPRLMDLIKERESTVPDLEGLVEMRIFVRVDAGLTAWAEFVTSDEAGAAEWAGQLAPRNDVLRHNSLNRALALEMGLRALGVRTNGNTASVSLSMSAGEAEDWIKSVDQAVGRWIAAGGMEGVASLIGQRAAAATEFAPPDRPVPSGPPSS